MKKQIEETVTTRKEIRLCDRCEDQIKPRRGSDAWICDVCGRELCFVCMETFPFTEEFRYTSNRACVDCAGPELELAKAIRRKCFDEVKAIQSAAQEQIDAMFAKVLARKKSK